MAIARRSTSIANTTRLPDVSANFHPKNAQKTSWRQKIPTHLNQNVLLSMAINLQKSQPNAILNSPILATLITTRQVPVKLCLLGREPAGPRLCQAPCVSLNSSMRVNMGDTRVRWAEEWKRRFFFIYTSVHMHQTALSFFGVHKPN